ncbi:hypothetical protein CEP52_007010 [Fusarium oligoseptatum]|uniref:Xylanolytic transcriptional activator regulatory domain-containing protein n=1 Tax=Fusarium oligoseptatum TaxID=2604345 RepID=A0A428TQ28_9HYPO|nr:hypothetical protein CEP52_007010 [Fusarium oligoseptatum]
MRKATCKYRRQPVNLPSPVLPPPVLPTPSTVEHCDTTASLPSVGHSDEASVSASQIADHGVPNKVVSTKQSSLKTSHRFTKGRIFGQSHWMNKLYRFVEIHRISLNCYFDDTSDTYKLQDRCKRLAHVLKGPHTLEPTNRQIGDIDIKSLVTSRAICDQLLGLYFGAFNPIYGVLHKPTFIRELDAYWHGDSAANEIFLSKLLLTLSIGTAIYSGPDAKSLRKALSVAASDVVLTHQAWQCVPATKHALTEDTLQVSLLSLIARQCSSISVGGENVWITAGTLLRTAMAMGFHRDPIHLGRISIFKAEMRRRIWYGIVEILIQTSLDNGQSPLLATEEWDTAAPADVDDENLAEDMLSPPVSRPLDQFWTQSTAQCALVRSLPLRLRIAKDLNGIQSDLSYEQTLELGKKLNDECLANSKLAGPCKRSSLDLDELRQNLLQLKLVDTLTRRFLLSLHTSFSQKSIQDPAFYFSRHVCLDSALKIWTYVTPTRLPSPSSPNLTHLNNRQQSSTSEAQDEYTLLKLRSCGTFKSIFQDSTTTVCLELTQRLLEDPSIAFSGFLHGRQLMPPMLKELHEMVKDSVGIHKGRIWEGETNIKGFVFFATALAQADAMICHGGKGAAVQGDFGDDRIEQDLLQAQKKGFEEALRILESLVAETEAGGVKAGKDENLRTKSYGDGKSRHSGAGGIREDSFSDLSAPTEQEPLEPLFLRSSELSGDF